VCTSQYTHSLGHANQLVNSIEGNILTLLQKLHVKNKYTLKEKCRVLGMKDGGTYCNHGALKASNIVILTTTQRPPPDDKLEEWQVLHHLSSHKPA
jgi:hypothetical protein